MLNFGVKKEEKDYLSVQIAHLRKKEQKYFLSFFPQVSRLAYQNTRN
jgi:hypothetical protein